MTVLVGKRVEEQPAHDAEDRRVGSDAEGERDDGDERESWTATQLPHGIAHVLSPALEPLAQLDDASATAIGRAAEAPRVVHVAEAAQRLATRSLLGEPLRHQV